MLDSCLSLSFACFKFITFLLSKCKCKICRSKKQSNLNFTNIVTLDLLSADFVDFADPTVFAALLSFVGFAVFANILSRNLIKNCVDFCDFC